MPLYRLGVEALVWVLRPVPGALPERLIIMEHILPPYLSYGAAVEMCRV